MHHDPRHTKALWDEDPYGVAKYTSYFSQAVGLSFTDVSAGVEAFDPDTMDAYLPYSRVNISDNIVFTTTENHLVGVLDPTTCVMTLVILVVNMDQNQ